MVSVTCKGFGGTLDVMTETTEPTPEPSEPTEPKPDGGDDEGGEGQGEDEPKA